MPSQTLALSNPELLAEYVPQSKLTSFFEKRLAAPPDHMAMLIRNGEIIDTYKGAHFSIGGILKSLKSLVTGSSHVSILLADLKPFSLQTDFHAISKDRVPVSGRATFELQVNPDQPKNVMGLVNTCGYLTQDEVLARFKPHLTDRVLEAAISRVNADEIRGDRGLQDHIQAEIMREIERVAGDLGLFVRATSFEWAINEVEKEQMQKANLDREQQRLDQELVYLQRNMERSGDARSFEIRSELETSKLEMLSDEELEQLALNREIRLIDARLKADRRQEIEALGHQVDVLRKKRVAQFERDLAESDHLVDIAERQLKLSRVQVDIDRLQAISTEELRKLAATSELEIQKQTQLQALEIQGQAQQLQTNHLKNLQALEQHAENAEAARENERLRLEKSLELEKSKAEQQARLAQMQAGAGMTPEQILATSAGFSTDVANVLVEQAKSSAGNSQEVLAVMKQMVDQANQDKVSSAEQAREFFQAGMQGVTGVAHGLGQNSGAVGGGGMTGAPNGNSVECPQCGRHNDPSYRFCVGCGKQLRS